jgi:hypothetical protein
MMRAGSEQATRSFQMNRRPTKSNPLHPSGGALATILPLLPCRFQLPIPFGLNLLLIPGEQVLRRDVADGAVQTNVVVTSYVTLTPLPRIVCPII